MKKQLLIAAASAALMVIPSVALAGDDQGWYVRGNAGYGSMTDMDITGGITGEVQAEGGVAGSLGVGYEFGNNWRVELDAAQLWNDLGAIDAPGHLSSSNTSADMRVTTGMLNAIYDFSDFGAWTPYIGAGIGIARASLSAQVHSFPNPPLVAINNPACTGFNSCDIHDSDTATAWQLLAGLGYELSDNLTWDTQYRYLNVGKLDYTGQGANLQLPTLATLGGSSSFANVVDNAGAHMLMTGFRYRFGGAKAAPVAAPVVVAAPVMYSCWDGSSVASAANCPAQPPVVTYVSCWDGSQVESGSSCPAQPQVQCWDGSVVTDAAACPIQQATITCWDGTLAYDHSSCPVQRTVVQSYNNCGTNNVAIFNVPVGTTPKSVSRLGTLPQFGNSHDLTPSQFYDKLANRYASNAFDRKYLNYLFRSMGYTGGFKDAHAGLFSEETLPVGTTGLLGFADYHGFAYSVLNTSDRDRQAFRIQGANGSIVHFMKTCGNYMYACQ